MKNQLINLFNNKFIVLKMLCSILIVSNIFCIDNDPTPTESEDLPIELINKQEAKKIIVVDKDPTISIHAVDTYLPTLLALIAEQSGKNIVTGPDVNEKDKLTIHIDDVPLYQAINLVVRAAGLSYEMIDESILVATPEKLKDDVGIKPEIISLQYANASEVANLLQNITEDITIDKAGNRLLINASPKKRAEIMKIISEVDLPAIQIMLEAKIIEVNLEDVDKMGIDWARLSQFTNIIVETGSPIDMGNGALSGSLIPGSTFEFNESGDVIEKLSYSQTNMIPEGMLFERITSESEITLARQLNAFDVTIDFLLRNNKASILANSQIVTLNGHVARIKRIEKVPYILRSGGASTQMQIKTEEVGIKLDIVPTVNTDGYITTTVSPEVSSIDGYLDGSIPIIKQRSTSTTVRSKDNEPILIGGLISGNKFKTLNKVPFLWRIPWIGKRLFTHTSEVIKKTDLVIQITPRIIKDNYTGIEKNIHHNQIEQDLDSFGENKEVINNKNQDLKENEAINEEN